jgi:hypothetical protein
MKKFLDLLGVKARNRGKGEYEIYYDDHLVGRIQKHKDFQTHNWLVYPSNSDKEYDRILRYATYFDAIQALLQKKGLRVTQLVSHIKLESVILRISQPRLLHDKDINDPSAKISLLCTVVYTKPAIMDISFVAISKGGHIVKRHERIKTVDAIIDFDENKFILPTGKVLEAVNSKTMIDALKSHLGNHEDKNFDCLSNIYQR